MSQAASHDQDQTIHPDTPQSPVPNVDMARVAVSDYIMANCKGPGAAGHGRSLVTAGSRE